MIRLNLLHFPVAKPTETLNDLLRSAAVLCHTAIVPKNPLRWIVSRTPVYVDLYNDGTKKLAFHRHVLVCGHEQHIFDIDDPEIGRWRHRCAECAISEQRLTKKPSHSVPVTKKRAA